MKKSDFPLIKPQHLRKCKDCDLIYLRYCPVRSQYSSPGYRERSDSTWPQRCGSCLAADRLDYSRKYAIEPKTTEQVGLLQCINCPDCPMYAKCLTLELANS